MKKEKELKEIKELIKLYARLILLSIFFFAFASLFAIKILQGTLISTTDSILFLLSSVCGFLITGYVRFGIEKF